MNLRQKTIFDNFGLSMGDGGMDMPSMDDGNDYTSQQRPYQPPNQFDSYGSDQPDPYQAAQQRPDVSTDSSYVGNDIRNVAGHINKLGVNTYDQNSYDRDAELKRTMDAINQIATEETTSRDRLNTLLDNAPKIEDYSPGWGRRLAAGLQAAGDNGYDRAQKTLAQPYTAQLADWTAKTGPFQSATTAEGSRNASERTLAGTVVRDLTTAEHNDQLARNNDEKSRLAQQKSDRDFEVRSRLASVKEFLSKNGDWELQSKGPNYMLFNPKTQELKDTGIKTGELSELDAINAKGGYQVAAAREAAGGAMNRQIASGAGQVTIGDKTYQTMVGPDGKPTYVEVTGAPPGTPNKIGTPRTPPVESEANKQKKVGTLLQDIFNKNKDAREWGLITIDDSTGQPKMAPQPTIGRWTPGNDQAKLALWQQIDSEVKKIQSVGGGASTIQDRAEKFLIDNGKPVTPANVDHVIKQGWVK